MVLAVVVVLSGPVHAARRPRDAAARFAASLMLGLELFLAAGLVRLASAQTLAPLGAVAAIVATRQIVSRGVRISVRALRPATEPKE
jgi:uncharacterized membrane protein